MDALYIVRRIKIFVVKAITVVMGFVLFTLPFKAFSQYDFNGDGVDELLHVAQTEEGIIKWQALDPVTGENDLLGYFGQADNQLAVGNWLQSEKPEIGVITHGEPGETGKNGRSQLKVPLNLSNNTDILNAYVQRKEQDLIISGADFDGNGLADLAVVQNRGKRKALWRVMLNPLASEQSKKRRLALGVSTDKPFTFFFRPGKESLAQLRVPKANKRALVIYHCRWPCKRQARVRISQELVVGDHIKLQVLRGGSGSVSAENSSPRSDALVFISETANDQELTFFNHRGRPERKQSATKGAAIVLGKFGQSEIIEIINGQAQLYSNLTGEKVVFAAKVNQPLSNNVINYYTQGATEQATNKTPLPFVPSTTVLPTQSSPPPTATATYTPTATATLIPTATYTPTATATLIPTATYIPTATATLIPTATYTPTATATYTPPPPADPLASNVKLYLKLDGNLDDSGPLNQTGAITNVGGSFVSNSHSYSNNGQVLSYPPGGVYWAQLDGLKMGIGSSTKWTFEFMMNKSSDSVGHLVFSNYNLAYGQLHSFYLADFAIDHPHWYGTTKHNHTQVIPSDSWRHIAIARSASTYRVFDNGTLINTFTYNSNGSFGTNRPHWFGVAPGDNNLGHFRFVGSISNIRVTTDVDRYVSNFDPVNETFFD